MVWQNTYESLRNLGDAFSQQMQQKRQFEMSQYMAQAERQAKLADQIELERMKSQFTNEQDPFFQVRQRIAQDYMGQMNAPQQPQGPNASFDSVLPVLSTGTPMNRDGFTSPPQLQIPMMSPNGAGQGGMPQGRRQPGFVPEGWMINPAMFGDKNAPMIVENPEVKEQNKLEVLRKSEDIKQISKARKALDIYTSDAMQVFNAIDKVEQVAKNLPVSRGGLISPRGVLPQAAHKLGSTIARFSKSDQWVNKYIGTVAQELIPLARKLMEEKGPITEFDVQRVEQGLGDLTLPLEDRMFLFQQMRDKIKTALLNKMQVAEIDEPTFASKYKALYEKVGSLGQAGGNSNSGKTSTGKTSTGIGYTVEE